MDPLLATHFAHLFIRDPIVIFNEDLQHLDLATADHFENLQSTNWQHMRFKPPPPGSETGWRVEFRPMEIQMTDFENAAFSIFIVLVTRAILSFDLNFYVPIQRTSENMETAHVRDAVLGERFYFRKDPFSGPSVVADGVVDGVDGDDIDGVPSQASSGPDAKSHPDANGNGISNGNGTTTPQPQPRTPNLGPVEDEYTLMTIDEIINGQHPRSPAATTRSNPLENPLSPSTSTSTSTSIPANATANTGNETENEPFPGLLPLVTTYLNSINTTIETRCALERYLDLIRRRASGEAWTAARWIRSFVRGHESYQGDSMVGEEAVWELFRRVGRVAGGEWGAAGEMFAKGGRNA